MWKSFIGWLSRVTWRLGLETWSMKLLLMTMETSDDRNVINVELSEEDVTTTERTAEMKDTSVIHVLTGTVWQDDELINELGIINKTDDEWFAEACGEMGAITWYDMN